MSSTNASSIKMPMVPSLDPATADCGVTRMVLGLESNKIGISPAKIIYTHVIVNSN